MDAPSIRVRSVLPPKPNNEALSNTVTECMLTNYLVSLSNLRPGGYIELYDAVMGTGRCDDDSLPEHSYLLQWDRLLVEASLKFGAPLNSALKYKEQLAEVGFTNIVQTEYPWPTNTWPKDRHAKLIGKHSLLTFRHGIFSTHLMTSMSGHVLTTNS